MNLFGAFVEQLAIIADRFFQLAYRHISGPTVLITGHALVWPAEIQITGFELKDYGLHRLRATVSVYIMHIVRILQYLFDYVTSNLLTDSLLEYQWCVYKLVSHVWTSLRRPVVPRFSASRKVSPALSSYTVLQALLNEPVHPAKNGHHGAYWQ